MQRFAIRLGRVRLFFGSDPRPQNGRLDDEERMANPGRKRAGFLLRLRFESNGARAACHAGRGGGMTKDEIKQQVREVSAKALPQAKRAIERGRLVPTAFVLYSGRQIEIMEIPLQDPEQGRLATDAAAMFWRDRGAIGAVFVGEVWVSVILKQPGSNDDVTGLSPSQDPNRQQAVLITRMVAGSGWTEATTLTFSRGPTDEIIWGEETSASSIHTQTMRFKEFWKAHGAS